MTIKTSPERPEAERHTYTMTELKANSDILQRKLDARAERKRRNGATNRRPISG